ncbi:MAG TPA: hypothetical protein VGV59_05750 [Pyrinomonadaceae bacterium]|nr:hypothetical protein [Pyrinomonadaceae bacterium]
MRNFAIRLKNEARTNGYLIVYAGRRTPNLEEANNRGRRAKEHLIKLGVARERVVFIDGGFREQLTWEVWVVPEGAPPPVPTPTVEPYEVEIIAAPEKKPCPESSSIQK